MEYRNITVTVDEAIATLTLARTERLNALNRALCEEIIDAMGEISGRSDVRAVVVTSAARIFSAGIDLTDMMSQGLDTKPGALLAMPDTYGYLFACTNAFETCRKPVIAAVNGACIGGGLDIITACDIRLCSRDAEFSLREAAIGLVADMGVLQRLPMIVGQGYAREMAYTAGNYDAEAALRMGLVNRVYDTADACRDGAYMLARAIAANAPLAVQETKDILNRGRDIPVEDGMSLARHKNMVLMQSQDLMEAAAAFMQKRPPAFTGE